MKINIRIIAFFCVMAGFCQAHLLKTNLLNSRNGLSNNSVTSIVQDRHGFIYIGTEAGLNRFDSYRFLNITTENSTLAGDAINHLTYDPQTDLLWIGSKTGLSVWNCELLKMEKLPPLPGMTDREQNFECIALAGTRGVWLSLQSGPVVYYDKEKKTFTLLRHKGLPENSFSIFESSKGLLFVGHRRNGLSVYDLRRKTLKRYIHRSGQTDGVPGNRVYCIFEDHAGRIWLGTDKGLSLFNYKTGRFVNYNSNGDKGRSTISYSVYDIKEIDGKLWIASEMGGISILDISRSESLNPRTASFRSITDERGDLLSSNNIRSLMLDSYGNIWIGNYGAGLDFIGHVTSPFHALPFAASTETSKNNGTWGLYADGNDVWAGCENGLTHYSHNKPVRHAGVFLYKQSYYSIVFSIIREGGDMLLGMHDHGLVRMNTTTLRTEYVSLGGNDIHVNVFYREKNGDILIGTEAGVYSYRDGRATKLNFSRSGMNNATVCGILRDRQGKIWLGTHGNGIFVFDSDGSIVSHLSKNNKFCSNVVCMMIMDHRGHVWIATKNGLGYIPDTRRPDDFKCYTTRNGLTNSYIHAIQEDRHGNIWMTSDRGISCLRFKTKMVEDYGFPDEITSVTMNGNSACRTADGTIYFGSLGGTVYFNPDDFNKRTYVPPVQISCCMDINNENVYGLKALIPVTADGIELPYDRNSLQVSFSVPDRSLNGLIDYAYKLEGHDRDWINTLGDNTAVFRNLPPGKYTFQVKARLKNQPWNERQTATLTIKIEPPVWLTWYAWVFYIFLAVGGVWGWFRFYKHKLELESSLELERKKARNEQEINTERMRFLTNITHELRTPLTLIIGPLEDLATDKDMPSRFHKRHLMVYNSALRLLNLVNRLLDFRQAENHRQKLCIKKENLKELVETIYTRFKDLNKNPKVRFVMQTDDSDFNFCFDREVITTIMNNLLGNAIKYTPEGTIGVSLRTRHADGTDYADIVVADTGYGIAPSALPHIFERYYKSDGPHQAAGTGIGLALVQSLVNLHEAHISVESEVDKGSTFTVSLDKDKIYPDAQHTEATDSSRQETANRDGSKPIILIVDDNAEIRNYMSESLSADYEILQAADGMSGIDSARRNLPDLIVSDIMMPDTDGIELCRQLKEDISTSHIPIILLTAKDTIQDKEEGYESGADSYLTKPFSARLLRIRIRNLLDSHRKLAAEIAGKIQNPEYNIQSTGLSKVDADFLETVSNIISKNITDASLDIPFITNKMGMSLSSFYRKIKSLTGLSGNEFIRKIKIKHCVQMLQDGLSISEAAYSSGFNDLSNFRSSFRKEFGITPSGYVKKLRER